MFFNPPIRKKRIGSLCLSLILVWCTGLNSIAQSKHWQKNPRSLHYTEDQGDFLLVNGKYRFNRALYGNHKPSRVEAGDLPEFALYMPGMAGNLQFVLEKEGVYKKLIDAKHIETRYRAGSMLYRVQDPLIGSGHLDIVVMAQADAEGMIVKVEGDAVLPTMRLHAVYGGASGRKFSRGGDIGADPESGFYLLPEYCINNVYQLIHNRFTLTYLDGKKREQTVFGTFGGAQRAQLSDATTLRDLKQLTQHGEGESPIVYATYSLENKPAYIQITGGQLAQKNYTDDALASIFDRAEEARLQLANRVKLNTPDRFINSFDAALAVAADGVWESPTFLHGAVAWRMRLNAWRGAYAADVLGWHDRAKEHFSSYANSQVLEPANAKVVMDTALHLARHMEEMGTAMFSSGYISRHPNNNTVAHHYDMNLVFFDQLFTHFDYTGDLTYLRKMWPTIERHLAWERRNFKRDGLYDAYCAIWASDGLQYTGGGVAHTTAYNYRANRAAAKLAKLIGEDASLYEKEADAIMKAMRERLWLTDKGYFAEYQDALGNKLVHDKPGLWTIYHVADAYMLDDFDNYQNTRYVDHHLPHIPIQVDGQEHEELYTLATTTWQPYTWSVNNVALAENLQGSLAYWQSGRSEDAFRLWKSNVIESMYHGISPGNFQQLSHYDAFRGELYRDFADPIGVASRTLTEGLFGFYPQLLDGQIFVKPGFPEKWDFAEIELPQWSYQFKRENDRMHFTINTQYESPVKLKMEIPVTYQHIKSVIVNGKPIEWSLKSSSIDRPLLLLEAPEANHFSIAIIGDGQLDVPSITSTEHAYTTEFVLPLAADVSVMDVYDPQNLLNRKENGRFSFVQKQHKGTFFVKLHQGKMTWWHPINIALVEPIAHHFIERDRRHYLMLQNRTGEKIITRIQGTNFNQEIELSPDKQQEIEIPSDVLTMGTNRFSLVVGDTQWDVNYIAWNIDNQGGYQTQNLSSYYNGRLNDIFQQQYLSPRPDVPTLQLPWQGVGNWCYPLTTAHIDDRGLMAARKNEIVTYLNIPFRIQGEEQNVLFTSQWDNYPINMEIPLAGKAEKVYLLMAGSTNPMQSQMVNARVKVIYMDGEEDVLDLKNPTNWWPIEQDYLDDNYAFEIPDQAIPYRVELKTGAVYKGGELPRYTEIKGFTNRAVDGGAATIVDLPLNSSKALKSLQLVTETNDVVIGLIAATLLTK
ncbi:glycogen debranching protein [Sphingobacterium gobiense]|uniref:Glycogen debranching protein n=2 Tax=Sphingobacterium gobiense TaxID=1382456 RepID=A0A2S9JNU0_9SPHI|nr:glycogen debranching protein [Sphingobacterium gobiense]